MAQTTPASVLQELCIQQDITAVYKLASTSGFVHEPTFVYTANVGDLVTTGKGTSKKRAKHAAAKVMLEKLLAKDGMCASGFMLEGVTVTCENLHNFIEVAGTNDEVAEAPVKENPLANPMSELQETCTQLKWTPPHYDIVEESGPPHDKTFTMNCQVDNVNIIEMGTAKSKRLAKRIAAEKALVILEGMGKRYPKPKCIKPAAESSDSTIEEAALQAENTVPECGPENGCLLQENNESESNADSVLLQDEVLSSTLEESHLSDNCLQRESVCGVQESYLDGSCQEAEETAASN